METAVPASTVSSGTSAAVLGRDFARALTEGLARAATTTLERRPAPAAPAEPDPDPLPPAAPAAGAATDEHADCRWHERRRVARDLHDHIGGALATARRLIAECAPEVRDPERLAAAVTFLSEAEGHLRGLLGELVTATELPPLREAVEGFAAEAAPPGVEVTVKVTGNERLVATAHRRALFLSVREALRNSFEHAGASRVAVSVRTTRWWVHAAVEDDGRGFDPARAGAGIASMQQRVEEIGGRLTVESSPVDGTRVDLHVPLRPR
ncbi:ATP-binding protein [Streptomyces sp. NPDC049555]|uniref:sensor histidine kinase n=1 Tax=unclassified Streptomyces TaxID=2593676 RepID=UPI00341E8158